MVRQHGVALVMVLAALTVVLTTAALGMQARRHVIATAVLAQSDLTHEAIRADAESILRAWCQHSGATMWTPSEDPAAGSVIFNQVCEAPSGSIRVSIEVWDCLAAVPMGQATAAPLRQQLPEPWRAAVPSEKGPDPMLEQLVIPANFTRFPAATTDEAEHWAVGDDDPQASMQGSASTGSAPSLADAQAGPAAAVMITAHGDGRLNVRTADPKLIEAVLRQRRRDGLLPGLIATRDAGEVPSLPPDLASRQGMRLVTSTDRWQALIRIELAGQERRWWVICAGNGDEVVTLQRHAVVY
ncbi:MAG: hypothetical protein PF961_13465 [Planctomycetota bacterium]|jgi:hypothetical protein|nr:hypothetical protein [Planctomycetota bacterium]